MRDPLTWSLPIGRAFGIAIRLHILFPMVAIGVILQAYYRFPIPGTWVDATMLAVLAFVIVLLHEFGHCFGARQVDGDAHEILMWPLGGLAYTEVPRTAWANFVTVAAGPAVNLVICLFAGLAYFWATNFELRPPWNPFTWYPYRVDAQGGIELFNWGGASVTKHALGVTVLARTFWLSWVLFLFNVFVPAFPLDGGRLFQCALWPRLGYHQATLAAVYAGFAASLIFGVASFVVESVMLLALALFMYVSCKMQWLELIQVEEGMFGYDFSQGYTSLEGDAPPPARRKKPNFVQRWLQKRAAKKLQREQEQRESDERRMDELLQKVQDQGIQALTEEERRFMTRVSARYKNRQ